MSFIVVGGAIAAAGRLTKLGMSLSGRKKRIEEQKHKKPWEVVKNKAVS